MNLKWEKEMLILLLAALTIMTTPCVMASPSANVLSTDSQGNPKAEFNIFDDVYVTGNSLPPNTQITIYIIDPQSGSVIASNTTTTDSGGSIPVTLVWSGPLYKITTAEGTTYRLTDYKYLIGADLNRNGRLDEGDASNEFTVKYPQNHHSASKLVVPEPGAIFLMIAMFGALATAYLIRKRIH